MKHFAVLLLLACSLMAQSGVVNEAKDKIAKEHHDALVQKAKQLLAEQSSLEAQLAVVKQRLGKLDAGEDVDLPFAYPAFSCPVAYTFNTGQTTGSGIILSGGTGQ